MAVSDKAVDEGRLQEFVGRFAVDLGAALHQTTVLIGDKLGLYAAMNDGEPVTAGELATRTGTEERYVREWLCAQAASGYVEYDADSERFFLTPEQAACLADPESPTFLPGAFYIAASCVRDEPKITERFRTGEGLGWHEHDGDLFCGTELFFRPGYVANLVATWLPALDGVDEKLLAGARVADIGCGVGWSSIGIAQSYPNVRVDGFDLDEASVDEARGHVHTAGLADRVDIQLRDAADPALAGQYDLVTAFECIHDMADPVAALRTMRALAGEHGAVLVMDERVEDHFTAAGTDIERFVYGFSVLHCLPVGLADQPSAGTGTVMRPATLRRYAQEAGFRDVEILPLESFFFTFYRLIG